MKSLTDFFRLTMLCFALAFAFPAIASLPLSIDTDGDGIEDSQDADDDGDGVVDSQDAYPLDKRYSKDTDSDGLPDSWESRNSLNPEDSSDADSDSDLDALSALEEFASGTSPEMKDTDRDTLPDGWELENGRNPNDPDYIVSAGEVHTCVKHDQGLTCFGRTQTAPAIAGVQQISAGGRNRNTCVLNQDGVTCWGQDADITEKVPVLVDPSQISLGAEHACALDEEGVKCWGDSETENPL